VPASTRTWSEAESKRLVADAGVPVLDERLVATSEAAGEAAAELGFPVVVKLCGDAIAHKTERGLVRLNLGDVDSVTRAAGELLAAATPSDGEVGLLVAPMVSGNRELIAGLSRDPQFGPTVLVGIGGIFAEALEDVAIRLVPLTAVDAAEMLDELANQTLLGPFRGEPAVDRELVVTTLVALSNLAQAHPEDVSVDINPLIVVDGEPVAVDALVEVQA
jgi:acetyl-CoA synthetase (ADP-forming)